jgi:hypothetical protein
LQMDCSRLWAIALMEVLPLLIIRSVGD